MIDAVASTVAAVYRAEWGRIVATLIRTTGDWDLAEECAADAFARALERWPRDGIPDVPGAWLTTTARHRALDRLRRAGNEIAKLHEHAMTDESGESPRSGRSTGSTGSTDSTESDDSGIADDRLRLIFTCCHPALPFEARVALTLRTLTGLTTAEIASAFLVPEATMAKRLVRAKAKIRNAAIPYRVPPGHLLAERLQSVLGVVYLLFNEGYGASAGSTLVRADLCEEALRLGRLLVELMPDEPEAVGLLALVTFQHARRAARTDDMGDLVLLDEQDRTRWDHDAIADGVAMLEAALRRHRPGPYQLQAAIAACHATAARACDTDWVQIAGLYGELLRFVPTPVVELNHAVAVAMADGPAAGLAAISERGLDVSLAGYRLMHATRADLLRRLDRRTEAAVAYGEALALTTSDTERRFLARRLAEVTGAGDGPTRLAADEG